MKFMRGLTAIAVVALLAACSNQNETENTASVDASDDASGAISVSFEKYELDNGLDVILHVDRSDPV
ncbi:MAG: hypothetical protein HKP25_10105, partial [Marinicaulis sp.]|nr:hypothetical protein [Marinicaulis sp.]